MSKTDRTAYYEALATASKLRDKAIKAADKVASQILKHARSRLRATRDNAKADIQSANEEVNIARNDSQKSFGVAKTKADDAFAKRLEEIGTEFGE